MTKILLIDDEKGIRDTIHLSLVSAGYDVELAEHGEEGLRILKAQDIDLVICDILMPGKEGIETIMEIRNSGSDVAIIAMSGGGMYLRESSTLDVVLDSAEWFGANYTLRKPFRPKELLELLDKALASKNSAE